MNGDIPLAVPRAKTPAYLIVGRKLDYVAASYDESSWQADCRKFARTFAIAQKKVREAKPSDDEMLYRGLIAALEFGFLRDGMAKRDGNDLTFDCGP